MGCLGGFGELGGHAEEGFGGIAVLLALEIAFAEPILRIRNQRIAWIFLHEVLHGLFGQRVVLALHVADAEVELVLRRRRRRQRGQRRAVAGGARRRHSSAVTRGASEVERLAPPAAAARPGLRGGG